MKYFWFMEFRGEEAPHFHLFVSCIVPAITYVSPLWYRIVGSNKKRRPCSLRGQMLWSCGAVKMWLSMQRLTQKRVPRKWRLRTFVRQDVFGVVLTKCVNQSWNFVSLRQIQELWDSYYKEIFLILVVVTSLTATFGMDTMTLGWLFRTIMRLICVHWLQKLWCFHVVNAKVPWTYLVILNNWFSRIRRKSVSLQVLLFGKTWLKHSSRTEKGYSEFGIPK